MTNLISRVPRAVWTIVACSVMFHLSVLAFILTSQTVTDAFVTGDAMAYFALAENLAAGKGYVQEIGGEIVFETFRTPGLPALVALFLLTGLGLAGYLAFIALASAVVLPLTTWYIGARLFQSKVGVVAAGLIALEPLMWFMNWALVSEIPFLILSTLAMCLYLAETRRPVAQHILIGVLLALSVYVRAGMWLLIAVTLLVMVAYHLLYNRTNTWKPGLVFITIILCLLPWIFTMHAQTGVYSISATGWRNVYTDYLASLRAVNNGTTFGIEKTNLKESAMEEFGISRADLNNPAYSDTFRAYALNEMSSNIPLIIKLQGLLFVSYFTHTDYKIRLEKVGLLPKTTVTGKRVSMTQLALEDGLGAVPVIFNHLKQQYFLPVIERAWSGMLLLFAVVGFFTNLRNKAVWLIVIIVGLGYASASAIGLGVEGRLRVPVLPVYFLLVTVGFLAVVNWSKIIFDTKIFRK